MVQTGKVGVADVQTWHDKEFLPWKTAMAKYMDTRAQQMANMKAHAGELQTIVAMLIDGRTKQALLAWNTLQLQPKLRDIRVSGDGESLTLVTTDGKLNVVKLDDIIAELEGLLKAPAASNTAPVGAPQSTALGKAG